MVDWNAFFSGKSKEDILSQLSQLTESEQQHLSLALGGNQIVQPGGQPASAQPWRLVILNNKSQPTNPVTYAWGQNWPHALAYQRDGGVYPPGDNRLVLVKNVRTHLRVGLLPLGPNHGPNPPAERVTISLHRAHAGQGAPAEAQITAANIKQSEHALWQAATNPDGTLKWPNGKPIFVTKNPLSMPRAQHPARQREMDTTQDLPGPMSPYQEQQPGDHPAPDWAGFGPANPGVDPQNPGLLAWVQRQHDEPLYRCT